MPKVPVSWTIAKNAFAGLLSGCLSACGAAVAPSPAAATAPVSLEQLYQVTFGGDRQAAAARLATQPILRYYQDLVAAVDDRAYRIGSSELTGVAAILAARRPAFVALDRAYPSIGSYWQATGFDPTAPVDFATFKTIFNVVALKVAASKVVARDSDHQGRTPATQALRLASSDSPPTDLSTQFDRLQISYLPPMVSPYAYDLPPGSFLADSSAGTPGYLAIRPETRSNLQSFRDAFKGVLAASGGLQSAADEVGNKLQLEQTFENYAYGTRGPLREERYVIREPGNGVEKCLVLTYYDGVTPFCATKTKTVSVSEKSRVVPNPGGD